MQHAKVYKHTISLSKLDTPEECMRFYTWVAAAQSFHSLLLIVSKINPLLPPPPRS